MDKNIKIAKQLVRLAKSLVAIDEEGDGSGFQVFHDMDNYGIKDGGKIADKPGKYKNFTGTIEYKGISGTVRNATFELLDEDETEGIDWYDGIWENGVWDAGTWYNGTWKNGKWKAGTWFKGTWENGRWTSLSSWRSIWQNGTWKGGTWDGFGGGIWYDGVFENGTFNNGTWYKGTWKNGHWLGAEDGNGKYHKEGDSPDKWKK